MIYYSERQECWLINDLYAIAYYPRIKHLNFWSKPPWPSRLIEARKRKATTEDLHDLIQVIWQTTEISKGKVPPQVMYE
jgi:hypothetical protein